MFLLSAAFTRTVGRLRMLLISGSISFVAYGFVVGLWSMVVWNSVIGGINCYRLARMMLASRAISLTSEEREIRDDYFPGTTDFDFNALWGMSRVVVHDSTTVIEAGTRPDTVSMVVEGSLEIRRAGAIEREIGRGALVGEMSYVSGDPASVDVVAVGPVMVREWDQRHLRALEQTQPAASKALDQLISRDLAAKARR